MGIIGMGNWECGMRKERMGMGNYWNVELGMRKAERKKDDRVLNVELGMRNAERKNGELPECGKSYTAQGIRRKA